MADTTDIWKVCPELAVELKKLELEWWFREFEEAFFRLLAQMGLTANPQEGGLNDA